MEKIYKINHELLNLADYSKKDVIRHLFNSWDKLERWAVRGDSVSHDILIDLNQCLNHEFLEENHKRVLKDFYVEQHTLTELAEEYKLSKTGVIYWIDGAIDRVYKLLNNKTDYKLY